MRAIIGPEVRNVVSLLRTGFFAIVLATPTAWGQVSVSGIFDAAFMKGGDGSAFSRNELINPRPSFLVQRLQLFLDADIDDHITFTAKLQNNVVFGDRLKDLEIQLAQLTFSRIAGIDLNFSVGRILTPFGLFARHQLSNDNPLIGTPLYFHYESKVSPHLGYLPALIPGSAYGGLSTMYHGGYYTGAEIFGSFLAGSLSYDFALTNAPLSVYTSDVNRSTSLSYQGRVGLSPWIFLEVGVSASQGPFMDEDLGGFRAIVEDSAAMDLSSYKQLTMGLDITLDWQYYRLTAEYVRNEWDSPFISTDTYPYSSGIPHGTSLPLASHELVLDLKVDIPYIVGLYVAARHDVLLFDTIRDPLNGGAVIRWDNTVRRTTTGFGYRLSRRVLWKVCYDWITLDLTPRPYLNRWGVMLSASL